MMGKVFINGSGQYARLLERQTHTGTKTNIDWMNSINDATVFSHMRGYYQSVRDSLANVQSLPAQTVTTVTILAKPNTTGG